ncbi:EscG/YscG/SsaH family type III secretion system needle protein co-chaperone [Enterobacterales bacterium CwR94]|nr:EscG/YscG/SsaH family type III secretion system needle protein co-chaperone [Enterobacterales bacterium CwR94]
MKEISADLRKTIAEAAITAVNHGLYRQAWTLFEALHLIIEDPELRRPIEVILLIGLGYESSARELAKNLSAHDAAVINPLFTH